jgi:hypothetical protein
MRRRIRCRAGHIASILRPTWTQRQQASLPVEYRTRFPRNDEQILLRIMCALGFLIDAQTDGVLHLPVIHAVPFACAARGQAFDRGCRLGKELR